VHAEKSGFAAPRVAVADVNRLVHDADANRHSCHARKTPSSFEFCKDNDDTDMRVGCEPMR
jgi:hypothetical protein